MTTNPIPGSDEAKENLATPVPDLAAVSNSNPGDEGKESGPVHGATVPSVPKLTKEFDPESIVNIDYFEGDEVDQSEFLKLINQYEETLTEIQEGQILKGTVVEVRENEVLLNIGFKSEGVIPIEEFGKVEDLKEGDCFDVFLEKIENQDGLVVLSKERADFLKVWDRIKVAHENGEIISGVVDRRIKGGLVVKLWGVDTFLPGSQVALRQVPNLEDMIGEEIDCRIIKKNKRRRNVVVSRRIVLEQEREEKKRTLIAELEKGQVRKGIVKNITDFGAFVDLGGIDGLLHITDLSWGRVSHPSEVVAISEEIEVKVLDFEQERERISLGLKQLQPYPWDDVEKKYPEGDVIRGKVVSITNYGAFVELEKGVEGLIHISEMSWTRHIKHPSKVVAIGDSVDVMVLKIDKEHEKISLGLKQTESDPWLTLVERYPVGTVIEGKVRNLTDFGAFVEVEEGIDGLVHISDMSWTKRVRHPKEVLRRGDTVEVQILDIDSNKRRISLGVKQLKDNPWPELAVEFPVGKEVDGTVTRMLDHGVIVKIDDELEGFVPLGHLAIPKLDKPQYYFKENEEAPLKVIKMDVENRRIVLSIAERLKDMEEGTTEAFIDNHPRLEDVVAADLAELERAEGTSSETTGETAAEPEADKVTEVSSPVEPTAAVATVPQETTPEAPAAEAEAEEPAPEVLEAAAEPAKAEPAPESTADDTDEADEVVAVDTEDEVVAVDTEDEVVAVDAKDEVVAVDAKDEVVAVDAKDEVVAIDTADEVPAAEDMETSPDTSAADVEDDSDTKK